MLRNQEKEDKENLEETGEEDEEKKEISDENIDNGRIAFDSEKFKFLFNPILGNKAVKNITIVKRSINEDTDDGAIDKRLTESLEIKIHPYVTKGNFYAVFGHVYFNLLHKLHAIFYMLYKLCIYILQAIYKLRAILMLSTPHQSLLNSLLFSSF